MVVRDTLSRPLRDLRISLIDRCNFRCPYCMPADLFNEDYEFVQRARRLNADEIIRLAGIMVQLGVQKVRLTGGEPLLRKDLEQIVAGLAAMDGIEDLALTTNGVLLADRAAALKQAGLTRITVSMDSIDPQVFTQLSGGRAELDAALEGIEAARAAGLAPVKLNAVVQKGVNDNGLLDLLERFRGTGVVVRMIEFMDVGTRNGWRLDQVVPSADLIQRIHQRWPIEPVNPDYPGEVASRYRYLDGQGELGMISSVTQPFCGGCNRSRLSSDGQLYTCLFASEGTPLRDVMRAGASDSDLRDLIAGVWGRRKDRYSELRQRAEPSTRTGDRVEMYRIGG